MLPSDIVKRFRVRKGGKFSIADHDPADTYGLDIDKEEAKSMLAAGVKRLSELQERLYAQDRWAVLVIIQAMDAAGKDGLIKHVMSGINPMGCQVHAFKAPSAQELDHDFMWRTSIALPERGRIGLFNRSYYEETLVVRVHPEILARQRLPQELVTKKIWKERSRTSGRSSAT
jgi:polyphosphate kinase 2 (PPK2 family)